MLAATVTAGLCFRKKMHSALVECFVSFLSILDLWHYIQFLKRSFNTPSWCRRGVVSCRRAQLSMSSDGETYPFKKKFRLRQSKMFKRQLYPQSVTQTRNIDWQNEAGDEMMRL